MSSTVLNSPDWFDESAINEILGQEAFDAEQLHPEERLDLWGFIKYYIETTDTQPNEIVLSQTALAVFEQLCDAVDVTSLRYNLDGNGPKSPYRLAAHVDRQSQPPTTDPANRTRQGPSTTLTDNKIDINLDRLRRTTNVADRPPYSVERSDDDGVRLTVADTDVELAEDGVRGTDSMGNEYCIPKSEINDGGNEVFSQDADLNVTNGVTQITF